MPHDAPTADPHDLARFVAAQRDVHASAQAEIARGCKRGHWMWFVFPQIAGLGRSAMAQAYALATLDEARAYLAHPVLGPRLVDMVATLQDLPAAATAEGVLGAVDAMKLRSSLTLFVLAGAPPSFRAAIDRWFDGVLDPATIAQVAAA